MMKKLLSTLFLGACTLGMTAANLHVSYGDEQIAAEGQSGIGKTTVSAALVFPSEMLAPFKGAKVEAVRVGLVTTDGLTDLTGWVRNDIYDAEDLVNGAISADPIEGWNEIPMDGELFIGDKPLAVGYSFNQQKSVKCISGVGADHADGLYIGRIDSKGDLVWRSIANKGTLSVELVVSRDDFPECDLAIESVVQEPMPVKFGQAAKVSLRVRNVALTDIDAIDFSYQIQGQDPKNLHYESSLGPCESLDIPLTFKPGSYPLGITPITFTVSTPGDGRADNDTCTLNFGSYETALPRTVLVEEFTTEQCSNCPRAINTLAQCQDEFGDRLAIVAHHAGFYTDFLTTEDDEALLWFYNPTVNGGTFAPAGMVDRTPQYGDVAGYTSQIDAVTASIGYFDTYKQVVQNALDVPAFVSINAQASYDNESRLLCVDVEAEKQDILDLVCPNPHVTVYIVEDGIPHEAQAGISGNEFKHNHAYRAAMTDVWGDPAQFDGNHFSEYFEYTIPEEWNPDNLEVVAFINGNDRTARSTGCRIMNTAIARPNQTGISTLNAEIGTPVYYDLTGHCVTDPHNGIFIRVIDGNATKVRM